jgi:hypothetical protein
LNAFFIDHEEELENNLCLNLIQMLFKRCSKKVCVGMIRFETHTVDVSCQKSD